MSPVRSTIIKPDCRARRWTAAVCSLVLAVSFAGCTADSAGDDTEAPAEPMSLVFGLASEGHVPIAVAVEQGLFGEVGLDVEVQTLSGGSLSATAAFETGAVDVTQVGGPGFVTDVANGALTDAKVFGQLSEGSYDLVVAHGIDSVEDLAGRPLGISGLNGQDHIVMLTVLNEYGLSDGDVTWITVGGPANRITALGSNNVDGIIAPRDIRVQSEEAGNILDVDIDLRLPNFMYAAKTDYIADKPETLGLFLDAMALAIVRTREDPEGAAESCAAYWSQDVDICASNIETQLAASEQSGSFSWQTDQRIDIAGMESVLVTMSEFIPTVADLSLDDLVDNSLTEQER